MTWWIAFILLFFPVAAHADDTPNILKPKQFIAKEVSGRVLVWEPWDSSWRQIQVGDRLWEESLVQVAERALFAFQLETQEGFKGLKADTLKITINSPTLLRLRPDVPRRLTIGDYFVPKIPDVTQATEDEKSLLQTMEEAWYRFAANVLPQEVGKDFLERAKKQAEKNQTSVSMKAKRLKLYQPGHDQIYLTEKFPHRMKVSWRAVQSESPFGVRVWHQSDQRPDALGYTKGDQYTVVVNREGNYLVQVQSKDGVWQSETRRFQVLLPMAGRGKPPSAVAVERPVPLSSPPANFTYFVPTFPQTLSFSWDRPNTAKGKQTYEFRLTDPRGKSLFTRATSENFLSVSFSGPGSYRWSISARPALDPKGKKLFSESRGLNLKKTRPRRLADVFGADEDSVFYLDASFGLFQ